MIRYSQHMACDSCGRSYEPLNPHHFSFNSPLGWCPTCEGLGFQQGASPALLIRDPNFSLRQGALAEWPNLATNPAFLRFAEALARHGGFSLDTPFDKLEPLQQRLVLQGSGDAWIPLGKERRRQSQVSVQRLVSRHRRGLPCQCGLSSAPGTSRDRSALHDLQRFAVTG